MKLATMKRNEKREALKSIQQDLKNGKSRNKILQAMSSNHYEKLAVGKLIASVPNPKTKVKLRLLNNVLILLLFLLLLANIYEGYQLFAEEPYVTIFAALVVVLFSYYIIYGLLKNRGYIYSEITQFVGFIIIIGLNRITELNFWAIAQLVLLVLFAVLAVFLRKKFFSNYGLFGLKKGKDGYYLLE